MTEDPVNVATAESHYSEWKEWREEGFGKYSSQDGAYFDAEVLSRVPPDRRHRLLEIGFGNGSLLGWAGAHFTELVAVEQSAMLVERARSAGVRAYESLNELGDDQLVDVAVAMDVLEHLTSDEIEKMLVGIGKILRPGGLFIARFPNGDSPFGRINQNGDITHVNAIGCMKMTYLAGRANLTLEYIAAPARAREQSVLGVFRQKWEAGLRFVVERAVASLYLPHRMTFDMNYVAVLRKEG